MSQNTQQTSQLWNLPNVLTMIRIAMVPLLLVLALWDQHSVTLRLLTMVVFVLAMATDFADGRIARARGIVTDFGKTMDPFADKAMTGSALIVLSIWNYIPWWITVLILAREIGITIMRFYYLKYGPLPANFSGKAKTMMQSIAITFCLTPFELWYAPMRWVGIALMLVALALTLYSGVLNVKDAIALKKKALTNNQ